MPNVSGPYPRRHESCHGLPSSCLLQPNPALNKCTRSCLPLIEIEGPLSDLDNPLWTWTGPRPRAARGVAVPPQTNRGTGGDLSHGPAERPGPPALAACTPSSSTSSPYYAGRGTADLRPTAAVAPYDSRAARTTYSHSTLEPLVPKRLTDTVPPRVRSRLAASGLHPRHPTRRHTHASYSSEASYQLLPSHIKRKSLSSDDELRH